MGVIADAQRKVTDDLHAARVKEAASLIRHKESIESDIVGINKRLADLEAGAAPTEYNQLTGERFK